ncbi:hypothetical protein HUU53_03615 [Candidatus Micrarchaeota archaeon]|nr:hypothetical protein [Candidatus Micrarchaeota archaeon]
MPNERNISSIKALIALILLIAFFQFMGNFNNKDIFVYGSLISIGLLSLLARTKDVEKIADTHVNNILITIYLLIPFTFLLQASYLADNHALNIISQIVFLFLLIWLTLILIIYPLLTLEMLAIIKLDNEYREEYLTRIHELKNHPIEGNIITGLIISSIVVFTPMFSELIVNYGNAVLGKETFPEWIGNITTIIIYLALAILVFKRIPKKS